MKRENRLFLFVFSALLSVFAILASGTYRTAVAAEAIGGQNYFQIWIYGLSRARLLVNSYILPALYQEAAVVGMSVDNLEIISKDSSLLDALNDRTNIYGFDVTGATTTGRRMYGYFSDPRNAHVLSSDPDTGITTYLFGIAWVDDGDGVAPGTEDLVPDPTGGGQGDGNGDGIPDKYEANATSLQGAGGFFVTITNTDNLEQSEVHAVTPPGDVPSNVTFPYGMFSFNISGMSTGGTVHMVVYVPYNRSINGYWKKNRFTGQWDNIADSITTQGNKTVIAFSLTDGGPYDEDGAANGMVTDQGGPGIGGGTATVPTVNGYGAVILASLMAIMAVLTFRKKKI